MSIENFRGDSREGVRYPEEYMKKIVDRFPQWEAMIRALHDGSDMVGKLLKDRGEVYQMNSAEIITAFQQGREQDVLKQSQDAQGYLELYWEWERLWRELKGDHE